MSQENMEALRGAFEASLQGDREPFFGMLDREIVWDMSRAPFPDARVYQGIEGVREWFDGLEDAFEGRSDEVEEITDAARNRCW